MEIFGIGWSEMLVIALVALVVLGPERLPEVARVVGRAIGRVSRTWRDLREEVRAPLPPELTETAEELKKAADTARRLTQIDSRSSKR